MILDVQRNAIEDAGRLAVPRPIARALLAVGQRAIPADPRARREWTPVGLRLALLAACLIVVVAMSLLGRLPRMPQVDEELATLLRGMAIMKAGIVSAAVVIAWWRFSLPVTRRAAVAYITAIMMMAAAAVCVWRLMWVMPSAIAFHAGLAALLLTAWRGDDVAPRRWSLRR